MSVRVPRRADVARPPHRAGLRVEPVDLVVLRRHEQRAVRHQGLRVDLPGTAVAKSWPNVPPVTTAAVRPGSSGYQDGAQRIGAGRHHGGWRGRRSHPVADGPGRKGADNEQERRSRDDGTPAPRGHRGDARRTVNPGTRSDRARFALTTTSRYGRPYPARSFPGTTTPRSTSRNGGRSHEISSGHKYPRLGDDRNRVRLGCPHALADSGHHYRVQVDAMPPSGEPWAFLQFFPGPGLKVHHGDSLDFAVGRDGHAPHGHPGALGPSQSWRAQNQAPGAPYEDPIPDMVAGGDDPGSSRTPLSSSRPIPAVAAGQPLFVHGRPW